LPLPQPPEQLTSCQKESGWGKQLARWNILILPPAGCSTGQLARIFALPGILSHVLWAQSPRETEAEKGVKRRIPRTFCL
jgi:hypothetical protein